MNSTPVASSELLDSSHQPYRTQTICKPSRPLPLLESIPPLLYSDANRPRNPVLISCLPPT
ncbi:hypothetical protein M5K25_018865 [Dendrobium thyrsiflorum]|uniref:Uncharacterized protein n=1 Tax=Dendrobium thyrsiflorum TaxID=117978 RepID=A0ABD0UDA1_DENTH